MAFGINTILHAVLAVFVIIELGLTGYLVNSTSNFWWSDTPSSFAFMLFNAVWSLVILIYIGLAPLFFARAYHGLVALGILVITTIFWFAGSIAMAAKIGAPSCHGNTFCQSSEAAVAFGFFIWAIFLALTALEGIATLGGNANADKSTAQGSTTEASIAV